MRYNIFSAFADNAVNILKMDSIGYSENIQITRFGPGQRNQYIIHYVLEGEGYFNGNPVHKGQGFLIYKGQREEYLPAENAPWKFLWIIAESNLMADIFKQYNADPDTGIFEYKNVSELVQAAKYIIDNNNKTFDPLKLTELFLHILNSHTDSASKDKQKLNSEAYTDFCVNYIEKNIHKKITVNELTDLLGVSQPYLYKIFSERYNMSVKQYIIWSKHNHAKRLLSSTDLTVGEVANSTGYDDSLVFSKAFKAKEGVSPTEYRHKSNYNIL